MANKKSKKKDKKKNAEKKKLLKLKLQKKKDSKKKKGAKKKDLLKKETAKMVSAEEAMNKIESGKNDVAEKVSPIPADEMKEPHPSDQNPGEESFVVNEEESSLH